MTGKGGGIGCSVQERNAAVDGNGHFGRYFMKSVAPVCISALIAIALGLAAMFAVGGLTVFTIATILVFCGFIVGWRQGERFVTWLIDRRERKRT